MIKIVNLTNLQAVLFNDLLHLHSDLILENFMTDCAHCEKEEADFDCNGLKFCDDICGISYLEPELKIVNVKMARTLSDKIPNGTKGFVVEPHDGLNQVNFENETMALCYMNELEILPG